MALEREPERAFHLICRRGAQGRATHDLVFAAREARNQFTFLPPAGNVTGGAATRGLMMTPMEQD